MIRDLYQLSANDLDSGWDRFRTIERNKERLGHLVDPEQDPNYLGHQVATAMGLTNDVLAGARPEQIERWAADYLDFLRSDRRIKP